MYKMKKRTVIKNRVRFTIFMILAVSISSLLMFAFISPSKTNADAEHKTQTVYVGAGDTLWEIANTYCDCEDDIRNTVYKIKKINNLKSADLVVGQAIEVPLD